MWFELLTKPLRRYSHVIVTQSNKPPCGGGLQQFQLPSTAQMESLYKTSSKLTSRLQTHRFPQSSKNGWFSIALLECIFVLGQY